MKLSDLINVLEDNVLVRVYIVDSDNINSMGAVTYLFVTYSNSEVLVNYYETKVVKLDMTDLDGESMLEVFIYR